MSTSISIPANPINSPPFTDIVVVKSAGDFGVLDSSKLYLIDGVVDMGSTSLEVPSGGLSIRGLNFDTCKIISSQSNFTLFTSPVGGSGNVLLTELAIEITGTNSQVFNITGNTGFEAVEFNSVNFNNCTSLGTISTYRQGLESGTGRFGGTPSLTLSGTWVGGYFIETSIARGLVDGNYALYQAGPSFIMSSRFRSNQNLDLNSTIQFIDFSPSNFVNPSTLQLNGCIITRNGIIDPTDNSIHPNIDQTSLASDWNNNIGIPNTFIGGSCEITGEVQTIIPSSNTFVDIAGTYTTSQLEHFDSPAQGQLRHLGNSPREFSVIVDMLVEGAANGEVDIKIVVWDDSTSAFIDYKTQRRVINNFQGGRDVAFFNFIDNIFLDQNDYVKIQVANVLTSSNVTAELGSEFKVVPR